MMNVAVYWYTNPHTDDNGVHGSSRFIFEKLKTLKVCKTGQACIMFRNFFFFKLLLNVLESAKLSILF